MTECNHRLSTADFQNIFTGPPSVPLRHQVNQVSGSQKPFETVYLDYGSTDEDDLDDVWGEEPEYEIETFDLRGFLAERSTGKAG